MRIPKRRPMHYSAHMLHDGTVLAAFPIRKPSQRPSNPLRRKTDADGVALEWARSGKEISDVHNEGRTRYQDIIAVNLNTRRAIRELVLPHLAGLQAEVLELREQVSRMREMLHGRAVPTLNATDAHG